MQCMMESDSKKYWCDGVCACVVVTVFTKGNISPCTTPAPAVIHCRSPVTHTLTMSVIDK